MKENNYKSESLTVNETNGVVSEMILLGNIMHNSGLVNEYADALSTKDFSDAFFQYVYEVLRNYYAIYGAEEVQQEHFNGIAVKLLEETGLKCLGISMKSLWKKIHEIKRLGSLQPADNEAYQNVKRYAILRKFQCAGINVDSICQRPDFRELDCDKVIELVYEQIDSIANVASLHPHEDFSTNITERALRFF